MNLLKNKTSEKINSNIVARFLVLMFIYIALYYFLTWCHELIFSKSSNFRDGPLFIFAGLLALWGVRKKAVNKSLKSDAASGAV